MTEQKNLDGVPFISVGNDELGEAVGDTATCPNCREPHPLQYGTGPDGRENRLLGFVHCPVNHQAYLASLNGRVVPLPRARAPEPVVPPISHTEGVCGGRACVSDTRIPVWLLWGLMRMRLRDDVILESYPTLQQRNLDDVREYVGLHLDEIARDIRENQED